MRNSATVHAFPCAFSIPKRDLVGLLADFCSIKRLAWSPAVKVVMQKMPASNITDAVHELLGDQKELTLNAYLAYLLTPVKQHQLTDLADWVRDLDEVPQYLQDHWMNNRIPSTLDALVSRALKANHSDEDGGEAEEAAADRKYAPRKSAKKPRRGGRPQKMKGPQMRGKVRKSDMTSVDGATEPAGADAQLNGFGVPLKEAAVDALTTKGVGDKLRWTRVNKYVQAVLQQHGFGFRSSPKRETDPEYPEMARVSYLIEGWNGDLKAVVKHLEGAFGDWFDSYEEFGKDEPTVFKAWFKHAG